MKEDKGTIGGEVIQVKGEKKRKRNDSLSETDTVSVQCIHGTGHDTMQARVQLLDTCLRYIVSSAQMH